MLSDESRFQLHHGKVIQSHSTWRAKSLELAMLSWHDLGSLIRVERRLNRTALIKFSLSRWYTISMQIATLMCHAIVLVQYSRAWGRLLNLIEHLWDKVESAILQTDPQWLISHSRTVVFIDHHLQHVAESMRWRIAAVLKAKGCTKKYWWGGLY